MRRVLAMAGVAMAVLSLVVACDRDGWVQTAPSAPSLPPAFGARVTDGQLRIWTGSPCVGITNLSLFFDPGNVEIELSSPEKGTGEVEYLTVGQPVPTMEITQPLPAGFDWRDAATVRISVYGGDGGWGSTADIAKVIEGSAEHPDDTYWFQDVGWLNPAQVAAQDGTTFLATCTPDPEKEPSLPSAFGARITDGTLRIWTGSPCPSTVAVNLTFEPDGATLQLDAPREEQHRGAEGRATPVNFEHLTLGGPLPPGLTATQTPPDGFDWQSQQSIRLGVYSYPPKGWQSTADIAKVIEGSAEHPDDTYWFQGVGWLNPAQVAAQDGKTFLAICTPDPAK